MFEKIARFGFLSIVFMSGILIGGIYTPEMSGYSNAVDDNTNLHKQEVKPSKMKRSKRRRVA